MPGDKVQEALDRANGVTRKPSKPVERPLQRRARERQERGQTQREAQGTAAMDAARGRSAEYQGRTRTDYTPQELPNERPSTIQMGTTAAENADARRRKPKRTRKSGRKAVYSGDSRLERAPVTKR